jgi:hypothetical protein
MSTRSRFIVNPDWAGKPVEFLIDGWPVIERFDPGERDYQVGLTDLTHRPKAILHEPEMEKFERLEAGQSLWTGRGFLSLLKPGEAVLFDLGGPMKLSLPKRCTDMTEAWVLFCLWGPNAIPVLQRLFSVDVDRPKVPHPFYLVTRWHALVVQLLNLKGREPGFLLAADRSHGQNLFDGLVHAGRHLGLKPIGVALWQQWFDRLGVPSRSAESPGKEITPNNTN